MKISKMLLEKGNRWLRFTRYVLYHFYKDDCTYRAAALTYTFLLSLVPLLSVSFVVVSAFPASKQLVSDMEGFIFKHLVATSGEVVQTYIQGFVEKVSHLSVAGTAFLFVTAVLMMFTVEQAFNIIWRVRRQRKFISALLMYWAMLTLSPLLIGVSLAASSYVVSIPLIHGTVQSLGLSDGLLLNYAPFLLVMMCFTILYMAVPNCIVVTSHALLGGVVAAVLFESAKWGFTLYISHFRTYTLLYGTLATIPIFLIWVYISWLIILFGAEVTQACRALYDRRARDKIDPFTQAYRWLGHFWEAQQGGQGLTVRALVARDPYNYQISPEKIIQELLAINVITPMSGGAYLLCRDLNHMSLAELHQQLPWKFPAVAEISSAVGPWERQLAALLGKLEVVRKQSLDVCLADLYAKQ